MRQESPPSTKFTQRVNLGQGGECQLQEQRISIGVAVEVSIVSVLREVFVNGVLETNSTQVLATGAFLLVLGLLMVLRVWLPPTFEGIDPEQKVSEKHQKHRLNQE